MVSYLLYRSAAFLTRIVPHRAAKRIAAGIAFCFYLARPRIRRNVRSNYAALGLAPRSVFSVFRNFSAAVTDFLRLATLGRERLAAVCLVSGLDHLDAAIRHGKGAILFAPHMGPWEIAGAFLSTLGYRINTVALEHPSRRVTSFFSQRRRAWGIVDFPLRECVPGLGKALARGEIVVLIIDRNFSRRGLPITLFGRKAVMPDAHIILARRSGAPLIPCCCYYGPRGTIEISIGEPVPARAEAAAEELGAACAARLEELIAAHPDQWFAFDHLWPEESHE